MTKELQDHAWSILPKEFKEEVKKEYKLCSENYRIVSAVTEKWELRGFYRELEDLFGRHNLTSDAEGEEMLCVKASTVREMYALNEDILYSDSTHKGAILLKKKLTDLFGSKCLPDELNEDNLAKSEPKNEGTHQEQCVPKNAESGTHSFSHILKDDFRDHNRLHIAAMAMAGMLANSAMYKSYDGIGLDKTECFSRKALEYADALIAKCEEGGSHD